MVKFEKVQVGKIDLDTCGAAFLHGLYLGGKQIEVLRGGQATEEDLANPRILCIEVGGSGRVAEGNFDHHGTEAEGLKSATAQIYQQMLDSRADKNATTDLSLSQLVYYVDQLDRKGPRGLGPKAEGLFPTLSDVFAGMLLSIREPVEQLRRGVEILHIAVALRTSPFGRMPVEDIPEWTVYAEAKAENNRQMAEAVKQAQWGKTSTGLKLAWLETDFFGAPGSLYGVGAQVIVAFSPQFGPAGVPKFTVAGNGIRVDAVLSELNARELGWGGPGTGTIIGSPREGSKLTLNEVVEIVRKGL